MSYDLNKRSSGVLLHLTSLPGSVGVGDLGPRAIAFTSFLAQAGQQWWQMLPIGPSGAAASPYQSTSAFAGDPLLISLERLAEDGWLDASDLPPDNAGHPADHALAAEQRWPLLRRAWMAYQQNKPVADAAAFKAFCEEQRDWLDDYTLFVTLKAAHEGRPWTEWEAGFRDHQLPALEQARKGQAEDIAFQSFLQWQFHKQWQSLKAAANEKGVGLIGDLPIFVSHDSADVWAARELFDLDDKGQPLNVAGVPPDYFSEDGQHWGNPLYRWELHRATAYRWWVARFWRLLQLFDAVRIDHFIGFHRYWAIPAGARSAKEGAYQPGPGAHFFEVLRDELGGLPIIAEDLGMVTPEVDALRQAFGMPGMRVLQFSFSGEPEQLPGAFAEDTVAYTGTHDNNTSLGWFDAPPPPAGTPGHAQHLAERERARAFALGYSDDLLWGFVEGAWATPSRLAIVPAQDLLGLGSSHRMNTPGTVHENWRFRLEPGALTPDIAARLRGITEKHHRL